MYRILNNHQIELERQDIDDWLLRKTIKEERALADAEIELKLFNDRALTRDLAALCAKVAQRQPRLPDGRRLLFRVQGTDILHLGAQEKAVA